MYAFCFTRNGACRKIDLLAKEEGAPQGCGPSADASPKWKWMAA
jgi:hypothetical protein